MRLNTKSSWTGPRKSQEKEAHHTTKAKRTSAATITAEYKRAFKKSMKKNKAKYSNLLIVAEGVRLRAESSGTGETPQSRSGEEAHRPPKDKRTPAAKIDSQSLTEHLTKAKIKNKTYMSSPDCVKACQLQSSAKFNIAKTIKFKQ